MSDIRKIMNNVNEFHIKNLEQVNNDLRNSEIRMCTRNDKLVSGLNYILNLLENNMITMDQAVELKDEMNKAYAAGILCVDGLMVS